MMTFAENINTIMKEKDEQTELLMDFIKVARQWQLLFLMEMDFYDISANKIEAECNMSKSVFKHFCTQIAEPLKIIQLKNGIIHILRERDLRECQQMEKEIISYPKTDAFLDNIKRMELYLPFDIEEDFIKAAGTLDKSHQCSKAIKKMKNLMKEMKIPPIQRRVGKIAAKKIIDELTHRNA